MTQKQDRHRTPSADVTESLLAAAHELLEEQGADAMTVRAVATRAGVAPMGVYNRFGGKDGLVEALFVQGFEQLHEAIASSSGPDALSRMRTGCKGYRSFAMGHPHLYQLMFKQMLELELSDEALEKAAATFGLLVERVQDAMDAGLLQDGESVDVAQQIWNALHGAVMLDLAGIGFTTDPDRTFADMMDTLLRGLAPR